MSASITHVLCCVCCKPNARLCKGCGHVAYCSVKCQKIHWPKHRQDCLPAVIFDKNAALGDNSSVDKAFAFESNENGTEDIEGIKDKNTGKMRALRHIKKSEMAVSLQPIMMASNDRGSLHPPDSVLCLTCSKWYQNSQGYRCSKCFWPVCSSECEKGSLHAEYECEVFSTVKLRPPRQPSQFYDDSILALRCLLLKKSQPEKFEQLFEWNDICKMKPKFQAWIDYDEKIKKFLVKDCRIEDFISINTKEIINYLKVIDACSLTVKDRVAIYSSDYGNVFNCAKYVFPMKLLVNEECAPNTKWSIRHSSNLEECALRLHATLDIPEEAYISACFTSINEYGATFPYRYYSCRFNSQCLCRRCIDPTELGSFFSGVRCQECDNTTDGYLVPKIPQSSSAGWQCMNPLCRCEVLGDTIQGVVEKIYQEIHTAGSDFYAMLSIIWKYKETLHSNHFLFLMASTVCVDLFWGSVRGLPFFSPRYDFFIATINLANQAVRILDCVCPGGTLPRARILFQLQVAYAYKHLREFRRYMEWGDLQDKKCSPKLFWELIKIQEEAYDILATEPYGSVEHELSLVLMEVIGDQMDLLCHQPRDIPMDSIAVYNLHKIYTRFSNEYYYPAIPIYEDKDIHEFVVCNTSCARHITKKINQHV